MLHENSLSKYKDKPYPAHWDDQHERMKAKLLGFINPGQVMWVYDTNDKSLPARYAHTVADYRESRIEKALSGIDQLIAQEPQNPYFHELKGQMLVDFSRVKEAIPSYEKAVKLKPRDGLLRTALAHAIIETAKSDKTKLKQAIDQLHSALIYEPRSTQIHSLKHLMF